jgi:hypothetical protein
MFPAVKNAVGGFSNPAFAIGIGTADADDDMPSSKAMAPLYRNLDGINWPP